MAYVVEFSHPETLSGSKSVARTNFRYRELAGVDRSELNQEELERLEQYEFAHGPMALLKEAVEESTGVVISCRNNHKLLATVKAFDRHCNLILENVKEIWSEPVKNNKGKVIKVNERERFILKLFLRGDSVIIVLKA